jgi:hypothetical protein
MGREDERREGREEGGEQITRGGEAREVEKEKV